jgi:hypothetical protein
LKKFDWLTIGICFIFFIIVFELQSYLANPRQITSETDELLFRTGSGSVEIAIDLDSEVISFTKHSTVRQIPFSKIHHVEYEKSYRMTSNPVVVFAEALVKLHLVGGDEVNLTYVPVGPKNQYKLATAISKATKRKLIVTNLSLEGKKRQRQKKTND